MGSPESSYGTVYFPVNGMDPKLITAREGGGLCIELNPFAGFVHGAIVGTADELHWLCDKLRAIVTAHESQTTLVGDAASRVVDMTKVSTFDAWLRYNKINPLTLNPDEESQLLSEYSAAITRVSS